MVHSQRRRIAVMLVLSVGFIVASVSFISNIVQPPLQSNIPTERGIYAAAYGEKSVAAMNTTVGNGVIVGYDYHHDTSPPLRDMPQYPMQGSSEREASPNPKTGIRHKDAPDSSHIQRTLSPNVMPAPILNFNGIPFPGVGCSCAPPDTDGEVGQTQYVQMVNEGYQVFNKTTGASLLGPSSISSVWTGFGGACEIGGAGDPVVLYDQLANRWLISQFASATGGAPITDECVAVSTTNDATGTWNRYGFHLGTNFYDYPHLGVWPDAYYMSMNVFNAAGTTYLGPQPFAFNRTAMIAGGAASFVSPVGPLGGSVDPFLPADLDGSILPTVGAPASFIGFPGAGNYTTYHFHVDFAVPANSTFTTFATPPAAGFTLLCPSTRACVPQSGSANNLDAIGDRLMFRAAYRKFADGHEAVVSNYTVSSGGVAGVRWFELRNVTAGPVTVFQESTYQPDTTWRWMGSAAMDTNGDLAVGFSASSASIFPQLRYAGRLVGDPLNTLAQGEAHLFDGTGSQTGTGNRWGDYSDMTIDPVDDCTFWFTSEYYPSTSSFNWRTRIGNFKFPSCTLATPTPTVTGTPPTSTPTVTNTSTPTATPTPCGFNTVLNESFTTGLNTFASSTSNGAGYWATVVTNTHTLPFSAFSPDVNNVADERLTLITPIAIPSGSTATLSFYHYYGFEFGGTNYYDGGVLEFSTDGGATWSTSTPTFISGGYGGTIATGFGNPLAGRSAWVTTVPTYTQVLVNLSSYAGQNLQFRFRQGDDNSVAALGLFVDDVTVTVSTGVCATSTATAVPPTNTATATPVPPTATRTNTPVPPTNTATAVPPTNTATATPVPPTSTATPVPPTNTATATSMPPTNTNTATPVPPTATRTNTPVPPTNTATAVPPTNTATATAVPPTATRTSTAVPATNTATTVPATNTATTVAPTNTDTPVPPTSTNTPVGVPTNTSTAVVPTATAVPPTATSVPPTDTATTVPPTATTVPPTATTVPPTATAVPPTATTVPPTATTVPPTNTNTAVPPTATLRPTDTQVPTITPTDCPNPFVDVNGNVFYTAIHFLYCRGVVNGTDSTHYTPAGTSTRAQFAKVVVLGFAIPAYTPPGGTPDFNDVPANYFAYQYIETGFHANVLSGYDAQTCAQIGVQFPCYGPNRPITRAQLTKLVVNAGGFSLYTPTSGQTFNDVGPSNVFFTYIETAAHYGLVGGYIDGTFRPNNNIRRDEMAQIVYKGITTPPLRRK